MQIKVSIKYKLQSGDYKTKVICIFFPKNLVISIFCCIFAANLKTYKTMTKKDVKLSQGLLEQWAKMTDENQHIEVRIEIANFLAEYDKSFELYSNIFEVLKSHKDIATKVRGYNINTDWLGNECAVTNPMFEDIKKIFGKKVEELITKCL